MLFLLPRSQSAHIPIKRIIVSIPCSGFRYSTIFLTRKRIYYYQVNRFIRRNLYQTEEKLTQLDLHDEHYLHRE